MLETGSYSPVIFERWQNTIVTQSFRIQIPPGNSTLLSILDAIARRLHACKYIGRGRKKGNPRIGGYVDKLCRKLIIRSRERWPIKTRRRTTEPSLGACCTLLKLLWERMRKDRREGMLNWKMLSGVRECERSLPVNRARFIGMGLRDPGWTGRLRLVSSKVVRIATRMGRVGYAFGFKLNSKLSRAQAELEVDRTLEKRMKNQGQASSAMILALPHLLFPTPFTSGTFPVSVSLAVTLPPLCYPALPRTVGGCQVLHPSKGFIVSEWASIHSRGHGM